MTLHSMAGVGAVVGAVDNQDVDTGTRQQHRGGSACLTGLGDNVEKSWIDDDYATVSTALPA